MKIEVLVSTMYQEDFSLVKKMNIQTDAIIINQCNKQSFNEQYYSWGKVRMFSFIERGLSKSRNRAINNSYADICVVADDDLIFENNYKDIIFSAYNRYQEADIIAFNIMSTNKERPVSILRQGKVGFYKSMKISSSQITFRRESLANSKIKFDESFGAGEKYICGEENILLAKCIRKGLKIWYVKDILATVKQDKSTWFEGYNKNYFKTKGAVFYEVSPKLSYLLISQFAIRKWNLYKNETSIVKAFKYMFCGLKEYRRNQKQKFY